jgi:hypothetical protein
MTEVVRLDGAEIARTEAAATKAEAAGQSIGKAAADAGRLAERILGRLARVAARSEAFLAGTEFDQAARVGADTVLGAVAGARALGSLIPIVGDVIGGAAGFELGAQIEAGRKAGNLAVLRARDDAFRREEELRQLREDAKDRKAIADAAEKENAKWRIQLGGGDQERMAAVRRVFRRAP